MQTLELFCGTKSFSNFASSLGHAVLTFDVDPQHDPDVVADIMSIRSHELGNADMLWASPPCEAFSVAAIGKNWNRDGTAKHPRAFVAQQLVRKTMHLIRQTRPTWWFVENPRGMLRTLQWFESAVRELGGDRHTVTYCQYGDTRMKPTDIWTNACWWEPRPSCKSGARCHQAAPRGAKTGTQGIVGRIDRARIPAALFAEIFAAMPASAVALSRRA
jgi:hypothetical protein